MLAVTKTVILFALAHFSHHVLTAMVTPLLPFIRDDFGLSYAQAGIVLSAFNISYGFGQIPAGWIADRVGPKAVLTAGIAGVGAAGILLGLSSGYIFLIGSLIVMGLVGGGYHPSASPLISAAVEPEKRGKALGIHVVGGSLSYFAAPLLGVAAASLFGWRGAFLLFSLPVILLGAYIYRAYSRDVNLRATGKTVGPGKPEDRLSPALIIELTVFIFLVTATGAIIASTISFLPLYMVDTFQVSEKTAAAFLALYFSTGIWAAPIGGRISDRFGRRRVVIAAGLTAAAGLILLPYISYGIGFAAILILLGTTLYTRMPAAESHIVGLVPERLRSTVLGIYFFAGMEGSGVLTPILGGLIDAYGFPRAFSFMGYGMGGIALVCSLIIMKAERKRRAADQVLSADALR
jgi:MFS family permease